jgi:hypothetical protein
MKYNRGVQVLTLAVLLHLEAGIRGGCVWWNQKMEMLYEKGVETIDFASCRGVHSGLLLEYVSARE